MMLLSSMPFELVQKVAGRPLDDCVPAESDEDGADKVVRCLLEADYRVL